MVPCAAVEDGQVLKSVSRSTGSALANVVVRA
jgi:hypothetical protein